MQEQTPAGQPIEHHKPTTILILGLMIALGPFSIDMYLPAFQAIANDFGTTINEVSLSLSSYFIGLASGQLIYGPLLDRFGRKPPMYAGLGLYILSSIGCLYSHDPDALLTWRFFQALGGCGVGVASMAIVRDLFTLQESAKVFSLLILILGVSPLFAPTIGSFISAEFGWHSVFIVLAVIATIITLLIRFGLVDSHKPDTTVSLKPGPIFKDFLEILKNPQFYTYCFAGSMVFAGLFVYIAGSPVIFLEFYNVDQKTYGVIFAGVAAGMILASQLNVQFLKRWTPQQILRAAIVVQGAATTLLCLGLYFNLVSMWGVVACMFLIMGAFGLVNPNSGPLALLPFSHNAGRAASLLGFLQMGVGALASTSVKILNINTVLPVIATMAVTTLLGFGVLIAGERAIHRSV